MLEEIFAGVYAIVFFGAMATVALWESLAPRRCLSAPLRSRWASNFAFMLLNNVLLRLLFPLTALGIAFVVESRGIGLFHWVDAPAWLAVSVSIVVMDVARYVLHYALHNMPLLWRLHRMHHTDHDYDFTTGLRFHPLEALITIALGALVIVALGAPPVAVAIGEVLVATLAIFSHGNVRIHAGLDRAVRWLFVTPDLHRVHHSSAPGECNHNYSIVFPVWDRLFSTYREQPDAGHERMGIGLPHYADPVHLRLSRMLVDPFLPELGAPSAEEHGRRELTAL